MARVSNLRGPGPGRPKGCRNHVTLELKEMIEKALMKAGGVRYLEEQAKANPSAFLTLVAKLLPRDVNLQGKIGSVGKVARQTFEAATGLYLEERKLFKARRLTLPSSNAASPSRHSSGTLP